MALVFDARNRSALITRRSIASRSATRPNAGMISACIATAGRSIALSPDDCTRSRSASRPNACFRSSCAQRRLRLDRHAVCLVQHHQLESTRICRRLFFARRTCVGINTLLSRLSLGLSGVGVERRSLMISRCLWGRRQADAASRITSIPRSFGALVRARSERWFLDRSGPLPYSSRINTLTDDVCPYRLVHCKHQVGRGFTINPTWACPQQSESRAPGQRNSALSGSILFHPRWLATRFGVAATTTTTTTPLGTATAIFGRVQELRVTMHVGRLPREIPGRRAVFREPSFFFSPSRCACVQTTKLQKNFLSLDAVKKK
jgi:hypothetical protein